MRHKNFLIFSSKKLCGYVVASLIFLAMTFFSCVKDAKEDDSSKFFHISCEDQKVLNEEFRKLVLWSSFGYTLFGDKPLSFELRPSLEEFWKVWERTREHYQIDHFILSHFEWNGYFGVLIGNKEALISTIQSNRELFQEVLGVTEEDVLQALQLGSGDLFNSIFSHAAILGVLLGYGNQNSWKFFDDQPLDAFSKPNLYWEIFIQRKKSLLPQFGADLNLEETNALKKKYKKQRSLIEKSYSDKEFFKTTLKRLCIQVDKER